MTIAVKHRAYRNAAPVPMGVVAMAGAVLLLVVGRIISLLDSRDPWLDEAMLALNFLNGAGGTSLSVLPYFDQVTTPLYAMILGLAARLPESAQIDALRAAAAIVSLIAAFFLYRAARRVGDGITPILAHVIAFATPLALRFSTELKHYAFDMLATATVAWLAVRFIERGSRARLAGFAIGSIAIMPASFMAPVIIAACGAGMLYHALVRDGSGSMAGRLRNALPLIGTVAVLGILNLAYYATVVRELTQFQFSAYPGVYASNFITLDDVHHSIAIASRLPRFALEGISPFGTLFRDTSPLIYWLASAGAAIVYLTGLVKSVRRYPFFAVAALAAMTIVYVLNIARFLPVNTDQHFLFLQPFHAVIGAMGIAGLIDVAVRYATPRRRAAIARATVVAVLAGYALATLPRAAHFDRIDVEEAVAIIDATGRQVPIWVYPEAQPAAQLAGITPDRMIGRLFPDSSPIGWLNPAIDPLGGALRPGQLDRFDREVGPLGDLWLLFSNNGLPQGDRLFVDRADRLIGECRLVRSALDNRLYRCTRDAPLAGQSRD